jgi:hypothetical protein
LREGGVAVRYVLSAALWLHTRTRPAVVRLGALEDGRAHDYVGLTPAHRALKVLGTIVGHPYMAREHHVSTLRTAPLLWQGAWNVVGVDVPVLPLSVAVWRGL